MRREHAVDALEMRFVVRCEAGLAVLNALKVGPCSKVSNPAKVRPKHVRSECKVAVQGAEGMLNPAVSV